jgi:hypothetical protein
LAEKKCFGKNIFTRKEEKVEVMEPDLINECSELFDKIAEEIESRQRCLD